MGRGGVGEFSTGKVCYALAVELNYVDEGLRALQDNDNTLALALFEQAITVSSALQPTPARPEPRYLFAVALTRLGRYTQALDAARRCLSDFIGYEPVLELIEHLETVLESLPGTNLRAAPSNTRAWNIGELIEHRWEVFGGAEGGMGRVYFVRDTHWDNAALAVKTMRPSSYAQRERFLQEAQVWLDLGAHPYVVSGYYTLELGGAPRFFMEYVPGLSLDYTLAKGLLPLSQALDIAIQIASGMEFVHARGVVHRDLKPQNCLLTQDGTIKLIDFGLGKSVEAEELPIVEAPRSMLPFSTRLSQHGVGTAAYMPPEQWSGLRLAQRPADVYSFGVMLYELLLGASPFAPRFYGRYLDSAPRQLKQLLAAEHPSPELKEVRDELCHRYLTPLSPVELGARCPEAVSRLALRCLEKHPARRPTFTEVRHALLSSLEGPYHRTLPEPLEPTESGESNRAISHHVMGQTQKAKEILDAWLDEYPRSLYPWLNRGLLALYEGETNEAHLAERFAAHLLPIHKSEIEADHALTLLRERLQQSLWQRSPELQTAVLSQGDTRVFVAAKTRVDIYEREGALLRSLYGHQGNITTLALSPDAAMLLSVGEDRTARLWDVQTGTLSRIFLVGNATSFAALHAQYIILIGQELQLWDTQRGKRIKEQRTDGERSAVISGDGRLALCTGRTAKLYQLPELKLVRALRGHEGATSAIALSTDGKLAITGGEDGGVFVWEVSSGKQVSALPNLGSPITALALSREKGLLGVGCESGRIWLWSMEEERLVRDITTYHKAIAAVGFVDAQRLYTLSRDGALRFWESELSRWPLLLRRARSPEEQRDLAKQKEQLLERLSRQEKDAPYELRLLQRRAPEYTRDHELLSALHRMGQRAGRFVGLQDVFLSTSINAARLRGACFGGEVLWLATAKGAQCYSLRGVYLASLGEEAISAVALSPDGATLATGNFSRQVCLWDIASGALLLTLEGHEQGISSLAFSRDGARLCSSSDEPSARLWDLRTKTSRQLLAQRAILASIASSPDGAFWAATGTHGDVYLWDQEGNARLYLPGDDTFARSIAVSPDGTMALVGGSQGARLWSLGPRGRRKSIAHPERVTAVAFGLGGYLLCTAGKEKTVRLWSEHGVLLRTLDGHNGAVRTVSFSADGRLLLSTDDNDTANVWVLDSQWSF